MTTVAHSEQDMTEEAPADVMIKCPVTGMNTYTGWFLSSAAMDDLAPEDQIVHCDHCHGDHIWGAGDVIWETF